MGVGVGAKLPARHRYTPQGECSDQSLPASSVVKVKNAPGLFKLRVVFLFFESDTPELASPGES